MAETHKAAEVDYQSGMKYKEIADKHGVSLNTVKSWKQRHGWERKKGAHKQNGMHTNKGGAPPGNQNAKGNKGGAPPKGNSNAVTHGFFRKHMPADAFEIMQEIEQRSPIDLLWDNIVIQYTAIIRAQQIMYVKDQGDMSKEIKKDMEGGIEYDIQHAWDKQATFLQAQSRAMSTLQSLIKQYDELLKTELATEEQKARIEVLRSKVPNKDGVDPNKQITALADLINNPAPERVLDDG